MLYMVPALRGQGANFMDILCMWPVVGFFAWERWSEDLIISAQKSGTKQRFRVIDSEVTGGPVRNNHRKRASRRIGNTKRVFCDGFVFTAEQRHREIVRLSSGTHLRTIHNPISELESTL